MPGLIRFFFEQKLDYGLKSRILPRPRFDRQIKAINDYAKANGFEIVHIYQEEGVSGTLQDRPALTDMVLDLEENSQGIKTVIIEKIDRLARDLMIQENILIITDLGDDA